MIKKVDCLKFRYECLEAKREFVLESAFQFTAQNPKDKSLLERAILVDFSAAGDEDRFKLECICRVIFAFASKEEIVENKELLQRYQGEAYEELQALVNRSLIAMGQNEMDLPEIDFD